MNLTALRSTASSDEELDGPVDEVKALLVDDAYPVSRPGEEMTEPVRGPSVLGVVESEVGESGPPMAGDGSRFFDEEVGRFERPNESTVGEATVA